MAKTEMVSFGGHDKDVAAELARGRQSTGALLLVEPGMFYANPETMETNVYQVEEDMADSADIHRQALAEFRRFRDMLVEHGVSVMTVQGSKDCPDHLFPNWISTHEGRRMIVYPMLNESRRRERSPEMLAFFSRFYDVAFDFTGLEKQGQYLESTGSLCIDRVNGVAYSGLSGRTSADAVAAWSEKTGYETVVFETQSHTGKPVYHTDLVMWIGTEVAAICTPCIKEEYRAEVLARLKRTHEVMELSLGQLQAFCGNSLEVLSMDGERMLVMSEAAYGALTEANKKFLKPFFSRFLHAPIPTIEKYGGGSARCLIMELF